MYAIDSTAIQTVEDDDKIQSLKGGRWSSL
jgi:hypothetical protein